VLYSIPVYWYSECLICAEVSLRFNMCNIALYKPCRVDGTCVKFVPTDNKEV
jgi:hypothetical protein